MNDINKRFAHMLEWLEINDVEVTNTPEGFKQIEWIRTSEPDGFAVVRSRTLTGAISAAWDLYPEEE